MAGDWHSVGVRQRTHEVEAREDGVWVRLSTRSEAADESPDGDGRVVCGGGGGGAAAAGGATAVCGGVGMGRIESDRYAFEQETGDRIWSRSFANQSPGNGCSPRSTPPASPKHERGARCGMSSESEDVWPVGGAMGGAMGGAIGGAVGGAMGGTMGGAMGVEGGDVSSRERHHLHASMSPQAQPRPPSR